MVCKITCYMSNEVMFQKIQTQNNGHESLLCIALKISLEFPAWFILEKILFHVTLPLYIGFGEVQMDNENGEIDLSESNFFQIEPAALLEVNLHKYVRFNMGAGYRFVGEMDYRNFNQSDISGLTGYVGLKFGLSK